ncbi:arginine repressor [Streptococcus sp. CSL10205-OR2]|uniref:arginine repressor n=1 Tax=Streptococcus sp. CSL10205-OR2 TaxID=2980558 RepID=UPI0021DA9C7C|nr:arginine repressor [Streptococcus sp. CSL10205-OR2]MCU9533811.1 arginine repressor [Streptococcus sp. CSL10205-OR2]
MNKRERHQTIKQIIRLEKIATQEALKRRLSEEGIVVTQATLSRDLREIGLMKHRQEKGQAFYSLSQQSSRYFKPIVKKYILSVSRAAFMLVIHTDLGEADVLANFIDSKNDANILGTLAGADTLLIICKNEEIAKLYEQDLF